ncbi:hypothetical protein CALCODRAFT_505065 [Calocera cornea HHB12733]|uniref:Uncharacterized protein n=1 Tax=Calocera cornea HHB12733 TaxID=1353952 RepID=A0A165C185_9BASI|nr:hypothetical protein CALCODRAFT_505065 [Calocera cornea HHB12733]
MPYSRCWRSSGLNGCIWRCVTAHPQEEHMTDLWLQVWNWYQSVHARYMKKVASNGKPGSKPGKRVDLGRTSSLIPSDEAFDFMLDEDWITQELPKLPDWVRQPQLPQGLSETIVRIIKPSF